MSDLQSAPVPIPAPGPVEKPLHPPNNRSNNNHGGHGRGGGGRGRGGGGSRGFGSGNGGGGAIDDDYDGGGGRRKKPELQHYKPPGAFNTGRRSDGYEGGNHSGHGNHHHDHSGENKKDQHFNRGGSGRGGHGRKNQQQQQQGGSNDIDNTADKVGQLSVDDHSLHQQQRSNHSSNHSSKRNKNKKPEQPHYSAKKVNPANNEMINQENETIPKDNSNSTKPSKPADDNKSEGGGSNTGTARRRTPRNKNRSSAEKALSPSNKEDQGTPPKHTRSNRASEDKTFGGQKQNGFSENSTENKNEGNHPGSYHHHHDGGRNRHSGNRNKGRGDMRSPSDPIKDPPSRKASPGSRDPTNVQSQSSHRYHQHDESNRSSVDRTAGSFNDRRSPSNGPPSGQFSHGSLGRSHSPPRRSGGSSSLGPRYQRAGGGPSGANRNAEVNDWRYNREGSHEDYTTYQLQQQQQQPAFDRWGNDYRSGGRGGKTQPPKSNIPPRFQRFQQQQLHHQDPEEAFEEPPQQQQQQQKQQQSQSFRRLGSGRRDRDAETDRSWRRNSSSAVENGSKPEEEMIPSFDLEEMSSVNDWSAQVEEEERLERRGESIAPVLSASTTTSSTPERGGIIRLPHSLGPDSGSWRSSNEHQDPTNPAFRGLHQHEANQMRNNAGGFQTPVPAPAGPYWTGSRPRRHLYDPRNPQKPIPAPPFPAGIRPPSGSATRFPLDHRFAHPPPSYRPPFPSMNQPPPTARPPYVGPPSHETIHETIRVPPVAEALYKTRQIVGRLLNDGGSQNLIEHWDTDVAECRGNCLEAFKYSLETDLVYCAQFDVEFQIWQTCFYLLVEALKTLLPNDSNKRIHQTIVDLLDEGIDFYEAMLVTLDKTYCVGLDNYYDVLEPRSEDKMVRCVLVSAQKCLLCLGDLARYKEQIKESTNYGTARQYYQKASNIDTRNGRPFNQLAILASWTKRKFEAVYYNMRCLHTNSPVLSSGDQLTLIFEDVRRKWESSEKKRLEEREQRKQEKENHGHLVKGTKLRKEIWIRPEGGRRLHRTTSAREDDSSDDQCEESLKELSTSDLNRRFNNSFLYLIGKLFTNINMDTFGIAADLLLKEFRVLVSRTPLPIDSKRLVQIMALNMFIIDNTKLKLMDSKSYRAVAQNSALQLAFGMFGVLVERCNVLLESFSPKSDIAAADVSRTRIFQDEDLPTLLSAVKVWCDWILGNNDNWFPVVCTEPFQQLAQLATHLEKLKPMMKPTLKTFVKEDQLLTLPNRSDYTMVKLEEDSLLAGFKSWFRGLDWKQYRRYAPKSIPASLAQDVLRLEAIDFCVYFLEGHEPAILKWSPQDNAHVSLLLENGAENYQNDEFSRLIDKGQDILDESYSEDEESDKKPNTDILKSDNSENETDDVRRLKHRKEELERRHQQGEESRRIRNEILSEHVSVLLEICPKTVVPDTNCFVDFLSDLGKLSSHGVYQLRVPVVVLNELDGLSKGMLRSQAFQKKYSSPEHAKMVSENAKRALAWLKERPANTKGVTSRGTIMPSLAITTEEDSQVEGKNNDDLILDACLCLASKDRDDERRGDLRVVRRDVVLLTEDRNLRLKAHTHDVPVTTMPDFIQWALATTK